MLLEELECRKTNSIAATRLGIIANLPKARGLALGLTLSAASQLAGFLRRAESTSAALDPISSGRTQLHKVAHVTVACRERRKCIGGERAVKRSDCLHRLINRLSRRVVTYQLTRHTDLDVRIQEVKCGSERADLEVGGKQLT